MNYIIYCIYKRVPTNTFSWYIKGSLIITEEALGFLLKLLKLKLNNPALFGIIFKANPDIADNTLLDSGFFNEGLPTIIPVTLNYFFSLARTSENIAPAPCPK